MERRPQHRLISTLAASAAVCALAAPALGQQFEPQNPPQNNVQGRFQPQNQNFNQFAPGQPGQGANPFGGGFGGMIPPGHPGMAPEMAKKTVSIMALRHLLAIGITSKDVSAALPPLREMRDAEKALQKAAEQALDEEKRALLLAEPGGNPPPDSGRRMQQEHERYGQNQGRLIESLARAIGPEKTQGLLQLVGIGQPGFQPFNGQPGQFAPANGFRPAFGAPGGVPGGANGGGGGFGGRPGRGGGGGRGQGGPGGQGGNVDPIQPPPPADEPELFAGDPIALNQAPPQGTGQQLFGQAPPPAGQRRGGQGFGGPQRGQQGGNFGGFAPNPGFFGQPGQGGPNSAMGFGTPVRISLGELVELLEQKQAARR